MTAFTGDIQILLYTEEENFSVCRDFYQTLLGQKPYYSWNESAQDCGAKFRLVAVQSSYSVRHMTERSLAL